MGRAGPGRAGAEGPPVALGSDGRALYTPGVPAPAESVKVVIEGHQTASEIFQWGFWIVGVAISTAADANDLATTIAADFGASAKSALAALIPADCGYDRVRVYCYPTGGSTALVSGEAPIASGAGDGASTNALQVAMVVTTLTGLSGRRNRGRAYLPACGNVPGAGHIWDTSTVTAVVGPMADFFDLVNGINPPAVVSVVSLVGSTSHPVTALHIGQRPDIQRRRANKQSEGAGVSQNLS